LPFNFIYYGRMYGSILVFGVSMDYAYDFFYL
jgi:hypothetical protein